MNDCQHEWVDEYYGTKCTKCETSYPHGCAPWDEDVEEGFDFGDDYDEEDVDSDDEWVLVCGYPDCCMPGYHYRSECHNGDDVEAYNAECTADSAGDSRP